MHTWFRDMLHSDTLLYTRRIARTIRAAQRPITYLTYTHAFSHSAAGERKRIDFQFSCETVQMKGGYVDAVCCECLCK